MPRAGSVTGQMRRTLGAMGWDLPLFATATALDQGGRLALNLIAAVVLGPETFGTWVILTLLLQYAVFLNLGVTNGAGREIPRLLGSGRPAEAAHIEDVAAFGVGLTGVGGAIVLTGVAAVMTDGLDPATLVLFAVAVLLQHLFLLEQVLFRSRLRFRPASVQLAAQGAAVLIVGVLLLAAGFGIAGLLIARVTVVVVALASAGRTLERVPRPRADWAQLRSLMRVGAPLLAAGILVILLVTVDRWVVLAVLGSAALGVYGLVGLAASSLVLVPTMISQQYYPRLAFASGEGATGRTLLHMTRGQALVAGSLTSIAAVLVGLAAWFVIPAFLPDYAEAVGPILVVLVGMVAFSAGSAYGNLLNLVDRQRRYLSIQGTVLVLDVALGIVLVVGGAGLLGAAVGSAVAMVAYAVLLHLATRSLAHETAIIHGTEPGKDPDVPAPA
jgi:O-antigen/teichoic acid export membrane protein